VPIGDSGEVARLRKRYENASHVEVVLVDCSHSMADEIGSLDIRKIEHARIALKDLIEFRPKTIIIAFGSYAKTLRGPEDIPDWFHLMGSTNLTAALEEAAKLKPRRTVIISDGLPDNADTPAEMVEQMTGRIDCVYCGPDGHPAVAYLQSLARKGGGEQMTFDGCKELSPMIRGLLA
jgi:uncharacterized protein with von Willebrand factor type A (vWA) domain